MADTSPPEAVKIIWPADTFHEVRPANAFMLSLMGADAFYFALGFAAPPPVVSLPVELEARNVQAFSMPRSVLAEIHQHLTQMLELTDPDR